MQRVDAMADRLPHLYRDGELIRGSQSGHTGGILGVPAVQMEIVGEDAIEVQIAHWFRTARTLQEAAGLADLLDFAPEDWQTLQLFRTWVETMRDAMLKDGAVTVRGLQNFVEAYTAGFQAATGIGAVPRIDVWSTSRSPEAAAFIENPAKQSTLRVPVSGATEPLYQFTVVQRGLDVSQGSFLLTGLATGPEHVPVLVNVTTGEALIFRDVLPAGQRLWLLATASAGVVASLEGIDVSEKVFSVSGVIPGVPWPQGQVQHPARAMTLERGENELWFLPLAHYDARGLDRFLFFLADLAMRQGRFEQSMFDQALFYQEPALVITAFWLENQPAKVEIELPAGCLLSRSGRLTAAIADRSRLEVSLNEGVGALRAAGVDAEVRLMPFADAQRQRDALRLVMPFIVRERGPSGADRLPDAGGVFEVTTFNDSTWR